MRCSKRKDIPLSVKSVKLEIRGLGHIPTFKNSKSLAVDPEGKPLTFTKKEYRATMDAITQSIVSQLFSACQTSGIETPTVESLRSWIVSSMPLDDSWKWIPKSGGWDCIVVEKGEEGADIIIEQL
jgi:hypothetical protein